MRRKRRRLNGTPAHHASLVEGARELAIDAFKTAANMAESGACHDALEYYANGIVGDTLARTHGKEAGIRGSNAELDGAHNHADVTMSKLCIVPRKRRGEHGYRSGEHLFGLGSKHRRRR